MDTRREASGLVFYLLQPGSFYQGVTPGGFTDSTTGIHIPGPKAMLDEFSGNRREVIALTDLPDPVQIPTHKRILEMQKDGKTLEEVERAFNATDSQPVHEGILLALATEIIRQVPDEEVARVYPKAWANRKDKIVFEVDTSRHRPDYASMMQKAQLAGRFAAEVTEEIHAKRDALADRVTKPATPAPPRRPPPPPQPST